MIRHFLFSETKIIRNRKSERIATPETIIVFSPHVSYAPYAYAFGKKPFAFQKFPLMMNLNMINKILELKLQVSDYHEIIFREVYMSQTSF